MPKNLVIVESPNKIKKIKSFLGADYDVVASVGHVIDLPSKGLNVDIKNSFKPTYDIMPDKKDVISNIKSKAKSAKHIYLMTDPDREGAAIARGIFNYFSDSEKNKSKRAVAQSITKSAITNAIDNAYNITDENSLYEAYECRRILDRIAGYKTSFLVKQATGGISAGRVQSAALRVIVDREKEILKFIPQEYWPIEVELLTDKFEKIIASIKKPDKLEINNKEKAETICNELRNNVVSVSKFEKKNHSIKSYPPFTTSTLCQSASSILGWKTGKVMQSAQNLFSSGNITYHRTDSTYIVPEAIEDIRSHISNKIGDKYLPEKPNIFSNKGNAQEAHEACRVTNISLLRTDSSADDQKLYNIIWKRTVASQMANMEQLRISAEFSCKDYILSSNGLKILFDGWQKMWDYSSSHERELPELSVGETVKVLEVKTEQKFTEPPPRYSNSSIIKQLETNGIGRPSTYKSILDTLEKRNYIEIKKNIAATTLGISVSTFITDSNICFGDLDFTAKMEDDLDGIVKKDKNKLDILTSFWERLKSDINNAKILKNNNSKSEYDCPLCKNKLLLRHSRFGPFYSCENWSNKENKCSYTANVAEDGTPVEKIKKEIKYSDHKCPECKGKMIERTGRYGNFYGCENYSKKKCRGMRNSDGEEIKPKKFNKSKKSDS